jgi:hypothetical protein
MSRRSRGTKRHRRTAQVAAAGAALIPLSAVFALDAPPAAEFQATFAYTLHAYTSTQGSGWHTPVVDKVGYGNVSFGYPTVFLCATGYYEQPNGHWQEGMLGPRCLLPSSGFSTLLTSVYNGTPITTFTRPRNHYQVIGLQY